MSWRYRYAGICVESPVALPEWRAFAILDDDRPVNVEIRVRAGVVTAPTLRLDGTRLEFGIPGVADYRVEAGCRIEATTPDGTLDRSARLYLLGSAWGALAYQRGWFPFHAGVVALADRAVAFCAPSGGGKSSLVADLLTRGGGLLSDDVCRLDAEPAPRVWRARGAVRLTRESMARLPHGVIAPDQTLIAGEDKYVWQPPTAPTAECLPLTAAYLLDWGDPGIQRLRGLEAADALVGASTYRPEFVAAMGLTGACWEHCIALARQVPVYRFRRPRDWSAPDLLTVHLAAGDGPA